MSTKQRGLMVSVRLGDYTDFGLVYWMENASIRYDGEFNDDFVPATELLYRLLPTHTDHVDLRVAAAVPKYRKAFRKRFPDKKPSSRKSFRR